jgi:hypothetical protein
MRADAVIGWVLTVAARLRLSRAETLGVRLLIRIKPDVRVAHPSYTGRRDDYPIKKGMRRVLAGAQYRSDQAVALNVVIRRKRGLPEGRDGPRLLMTDPSGNAVRSTDLLARRMAIEEPFRDGKDGRYGLGPGQVQVETAGRLDRLILIAALALTLSSGPGRVARGDFRPSAWCSGNDPRECSHVTVGRRMWDRIDQPPERLIDEIVRATLDVVGNWG